MSQNSGDYSSFSENEEINGSDDALSKTEMLKAGTCADSFSSDEEIEVTDEEIKGTDSECDSSSNWSIF